MLAYWYHAYYRINLTKTHGVISVCLELIQLTPSKYYLNQIGLVIPFHIYVGVAVIVYVWIINKSRGALFWSPCRNPKSFIDKTVCTISSVLGRFTPCCLIGTKQSRWPIWTHVRHTNIYSVLKCKCVTYVKCPYVHRGPPQSENGPQDPDIQCKSDLSIRFGEHHTDCKMVMWRFFCKGMIWTFTSIIRTQKRNVY